MIWKPVRRWMLYEKWAEWYDNWVQNPNKRFYRYIATGKSRSFVGEAAYHYDPGEGIYLADVIIAAQCRRQGFGKAGLQMLCEHAKNEKIPELYDNIAIDNTGIHLFLQCGFQELIASSREKQQRVASKKVGGRGIIRGLLVFFC